MPENKSFSISPGSEDWLCQLKLALFVTACGPSRIFSMFFNMEYLLFQNFHKISGKAPEQSFHYILGSIRPRAPDAWIFIRKQPTMMTPYIPL